MDSTVSQPSESVQVRRYGPEESPYIVGGEELGNFLASTDAALAAIAQAARFHARVHAELQRKANALATARRALISDVDARRTMRRKASA